MVKQVVPHAPKSKLTVFASRLGGSLIDLILPPRCVATGKAVDRQGMVDPAYWAKLRFIEKPFCATCGLPFDFSVDGDDAQCAQCLRAPPEFDRARAALVYDDASRKMILGFKYGDRLHAAPAFGAWLARAGTELLAEADILTPVPLHRARLWRRRFNQSALLAQDIARRTGLRFEALLLERHRATPQQAGLNREARQRNVRNAFQVRPEYLETVKNRRVALIDDVFTSGATLNECARALRQAGAAQVFALTLARTVKE